MFPEVFLECGLSLAPSVLFFIFLIHFIVFFLLRYCMHARTHALKRARTHGRTHASAIALITREDVNTVGVSDQTEYTDRILNNAKMV